MLIDTSIVWKESYEKSNRLKSILKNLLLNSIAHKSVKIVECELLGESKITTTIKRKQIQYGKITFEQIKISLPTGYSLKRTMYGGFIFSISENWIYII